MVEQRRPRNGDGDHGITTSLLLFFLYKRNLAWEGLEMKRPSAATHETLRVRRGLRRSSVRQTPHQLLAQRQRWPMSIVSSLF